MNVAVYGRVFDENFSPFVQELFDVLEENNVQLFIYEPFNAYLTPRININPNVKFFSRYDHLIGRVNFLLSIGGDGTLLDTITMIRDSEIPILGINTGRLGFLANTAKEDIRQTLLAVLQGKFQLDKRTLLKVDSPNSLFGRNNFALNELTVHKKDSSSMITIHTYINNKLLNSYWADGLIISTPTGSTAYSLSCGGPIIIPNSQNFVITPIAPHNLNVRPIVVPDDNQIRLVVEGRSNEYLASLDSRSESIDSSCELLVSRNEFKINLIQVDNVDFFSTIHNKLLWGLDKRN